MLFLNLPAGLIAVCLATLIHAADNVCYFPNGSPSTDVPCNPSTPFSMCCASSTACLGSGLCKDVSTNATSADTDKFLRATCTDPSWDSAVCPPYCLPRPASNGTIFNLALTRNDVHIRQCRTQNGIKAFGALARFCCGTTDEHTECCSKPSTFFELSKVSSPAAQNPAAGEVSSLASSSSPSTSTFSWATPKAPGIVVASSTWCGNPTGMCTGDTTVDPSAASDTPTSTASNTTADPSTSDSSVPSTDPPSTVSSATVAATSTSSVPASTRPTSAQPSKVIATALADSTSGSGTADGTDSSFDDNSNSSNKDVSSSSSASGEFVKSSRPSSTRLSTGAVVGIGLGVSVAAAGLVTISVYFFARRRLYMKQKKRWEAQMKALQQQDDGSGGGSDAGGSSNSGLQNMVAVQTQMADGRPAVVMLTQAQAEDGTWAQNNGDMFKMAADGQHLWDAEGPSPISVRTLRDREWGQEERRSVSEFSLSENNKQASVVAAVELADAPALQKVVVATTTTTITGGDKLETPVEPREGRTVTWFARHSVYEMG